MNYQNPIIKGFYPDPSICRVGDTFYLVNSTFQYLPGIPIFKSQDLVNWQQIGHCLTRPSQIEMKGVECSLGIFAPTLRFYQGKFYLITTNITKGNFIISATNPAETWSDPIFVNIPGIDPSFFFENERVYLQYAHEAAIWQVEINIETGALLSEPKIITLGSGGRDVEGPHLYRIQDYYYLLTAEGGTREGHMITLRRGTSIWGPFEECPHNPILTNRNQPSQLLQNVGHGDLVEDSQGHWWLVALGVRSVNLKHHLGRETILMPVTWDEAGWPVVGKGFAEINIEATLPQANLQLKPTLQRDDFDSDPLSLKWNSLREFIDDQYSLTERPGFLTLKASQASLNDLGKVCFLGRRQQDFKCEVLTKMEFNSEKANEEAGLTVYGDRNHRFDLCLREDKVVLRKKSLDIVAETEANAHGNQIVYFKILANQLSYQFFYSFNNIDYLSIGETYTKHLATEVINAPFTGVYLGIYCTGNGYETQAKAYFDYFIYESQE